MIPQFNELSLSEQERLIKAPAIASVLAAEWDDEISILEKADAIKLAHIKTYTGDPALREYFKLVEGSFVRNFEEAAKQYTPFDAEKKKELEREMAEINAVILKLDRSFARKLHTSLANYAKHVKHAGKSILDTFVFPIPIKGLSD